MISVEEKLNHFSSNVLRKASLQREEMLEQMRKKEKGILEQKELEFLEEAYEKIQDSVASIQKEHMEQRARLQNECKTALLKERQKIFDSVFAEVEQRLSAFCQSGEYAAWLKEKAETACRDALEGDRICYIDRRDEAYRSQIQQAVGFAVELSDEELIGGCIVKNRSRNVIIDNSIRALLEEQKQEFVRTCGLGMNLLSEKSGE